MMRRYAVVCALVIAVGTPLSAEAEAPVRQGHIVIDAAQFLADFPQGTAISYGMPSAGRGRGRGAAGAGGAATRPAAGAPAFPARFVFEDFAMTLNSTTPLSAKLNVPEAGEYHLYVHTLSTGPGAFKVRVGAQATREAFGASPGLRDAGTFSLKPGPLTVTIADIEGVGAAFDVLVLSKKADLQEADLAPLQYPEDIVLLKEYAVVRPDGVKFGDLNGDGKMDLVVITPNYSTYAYDHSGKELWHYDAPEEGSNLRQQFEGPGTVWDFDRDGKAEVVAWRSIEGKEYLVMSDGITGAIKYKTDWPNNLAPGHVYNNFRTAVAKFSPDYPDTLLVYTDSGGTVSLTAFDGTLQQRWAYVQKRQKDYYGHYIYPVDINGDGIDEAYISHVMLDAKGKELWNNYALFPDNHDHVDSARFMDITGDGKLELLAGQSDVGTVVYDAATGKLLWQRFANHNQKIEGGLLRTNVPHPERPQVVANSRYYSGGLGAQLRWFDIDGTPLGVWPKFPVPGNPNFTKGDFKGDGKPTLFWHRYRIASDGTGTLAFPDEVFHMFDFMGTGTDQVITLGRNGAVRVYGFKNAPTRAAKRSPDYLAHSVSNHTHY
jgi:hypothetical protein